MKPSPVTKDTRWLFIGDSITDYGRREDPEGLGRGYRDKTLPQSQCGKAITYLLSQWDMLVAHASCGYTRLDTNLIENLTRVRQFGKCDCCESAFCTI